MPSPASAAPPPRSAPPAADDLVAWDAESHKVTQVAREIRIPFRVIGDDVHVQFFCGHDEVRGKPRKASQKKAYIAVEVTRSFPARRVHGRIHVLPGTRGNSLPSKMFETAPFVPVSFDVQEVVLGEHDDVEQRIQEGVRRKLKEAVLFMVDYFLDKETAGAVTEQDEEEDTSSSKSVSITETQSLVHEVTVLALQANPQNGPKAEKDVMTDITQLGSIASNLNLHIDNKYDKEIKDKDDKDEDKDKVLERTKEDMAAKKAETDRKEVKKEPNEEEEPSKLHLHVSQLLKQGLISHADAAKMLM